MGMSGKSGSCRKIESIAVGAFYQSRKKIKPGWSEAFRRRDTETWRGRCTGIRPSFFISRRRIECIRYGKNRTALQSKLKII